MIDHEQLRETHRALVRQVMREAGMKTPSALATAMGKRPSLLNKVMSTSPKNKHVLSAPTLKLIEEFRRTLPGEKVGNVDPEVASNLSKQERDLIILGRIWPKLDSDVQTAAMTLLDALTRAKAS